MEVNRKNLPCPPELEIKRIDKMIKKVVLIWIFSLILASCLFTFFAEKKETEKTREMKKITQEEQIELQKLPKKYKKQEGKN